MPHLQRLVRSRILQNLTGFGSLLQISESHYDLGGTEEKTNLFSSHKEKKGKWRTSLNLVTNQNLGSGFVVFFGQAKNLQFCFQINQTDRSGNGI